MHFDLHDFDLNFVFAPDSSVVGLQALIDEYL